MTLTKNTPLRRLLAAQLAALIATSAWAQVAPATTEAVPAQPPAPTKKIPVETKKIDADSDTPSSEDETIILSPFEVVSENKGYFAANTMSGTRLNSKIEDLGQPITVMTKEQMSDFAMLDINDVFDYMAGTEGTNSYSQFTTDRTGAVVDNVSLSPNTANRVRGIGNANIAFGNIATTGRVPVDPLWMDALELSRGPNANIFGLGNAAGTVNQVPATANLTKNFTRTELRADSYEGWRASLDVNRVLIKNKLSVRASYAYQHTGFIRKPAEEDAKRLSFQIKAQPFKSTTISASYYGYKNTAVRPNYTTPRDYYTDWVEAGKPGWNPATGYVTLNGQQLGAGNLPSTGSNPYTAAPSYFTGGSESRSPFLIGAPGEPIYWLRPAYTAAGSLDPYANTSLPTTPTSNLPLRIGFLTTGPSDTYTATQQPLYNSVARPISDKSIYDWTKINLAGNSKAWDDVDTYLIQLDQFVLNTAKHTLAFQGAYMREDAKRLENQPMGPASVNSNVGQLQVDVNTHFLDGTPNPYFGRPYLRSSEPYLRDKPMLWDTYRAQGAYRIDFSQDRGWSKWLGTQQLLGYYEYKDQQNRTYNYRHTAVTLDNAWLQNYAALNAPLGLQSNGNARAQYLAVAVPPNIGALQVGTNYPRLNEQYYVGSTPGGGIEYAPNYFPEGARVPYIWGSPGAMNRDVTTIGWSPVFGGGLNNVNTRIKTMGGVLQSTFLGGKLVGTYGLREDEVFDRNAPLALLTPDLRGFDFGVSNQWTSDWRKAAGKTKTLSVVARPFRDIPFLKSQVSNGSGVGKFLSEVVTSFSPTYNKSDNFIAQGPAYDLFLKKLPNQTGTSKDIGFWITALDNKISIRYTYYDTKQLNLRDGDISTMAQRILRYEGFVSNDAWNLRKQATAWLNNVGTGGTASDTQIAAAINMPLAQYQGLQTIGANGTYAAVNDVQAKGHEVEINYNPTRHWTVSASVTKGESINTSAGAAVDDYIAARMATWTTLEDPRYRLVSTAPSGANTIATYSTTLTGGTFNVTYSDPTLVIPNGPNGNLLWWRILGTPFSSGATNGGYNGTNSAASNFAGNVNSPMSVFRALIGRPRPQVREYNAKFNTKLNLAAISDQKIIKNMAIGGSVRYASKGSIGFYGKGYTEGMNLRSPANQILELDTNRPIYSPAETYVDLFVSYNTKLFNDKVKARFQLNVKNVTEDGGGLQATQAFFDGQTATYRIIDPRQFILSANFEF
ncbi:TonB-dependent receptor [Nibricoccus aquaticus]|uniref:TonB-dependent receptor n=1 Tax=Nibricoccus aquaticus TaxID=2576891 RepID=A0A290Q4V0_9BACT|nr:TonB-dependent receptor [Nibricoccus aquaticus]ATC63715.1 TonB-dependent receptor [Nibricoccus aquaticus]